MHLDKHGARLACRKHIAQRLGASHERRLVRARCLEHDLSIAHLGNHCVAYGEHTQERVHIVGQRVATSQDLAQVAPCVPLARRRVIHNISKGDASDGRLAKLHLIPCERAGLVGKDIVNLSQVFHQIRAAAQCRRVLWLIVQVQVRVDQIRQLQLHNIHRHDERDGNQTVVQNNERKH